MTSTPRFFIVRVPTSCLTRAAFSGFSRKGNSSTTRNAWANGVGTWLSLLTQAIFGSMSQPPTFAATAVTSPARMTASSGSYRYAPGASTKEHSSSSEVNVAPEGNRVARRDTVAKSAPHRQASTRLPSTLIHSASTPAGMSRWAIPGIVLARLRPPRRAVTKSHGGTQLVGSKIRPLPSRRAGSTNAASSEAMATVVASSQETVPERPSATRLACAIAARTGSYSMPRTRTP